MNHIFGVAFRYASSFNLCSKLILLVWGRILLSCADNLAVIPLRQLKRSAPPALIKTTGISWVLAR